MDAHRIRSELIAWICGGVIGAIAGLALGALSSLLVGIVVGIVVGLVVALSIRRGRGRQGWSDEDGDSMVGDGAGSADIHRPVVKGTPSPADLPVTPGMGATGLGPTGTGS